MELNNWKISKFNKDIGSRTMLLCNVLDKIRRNEYNTIEPLK